MRCVIVCGLFFFVWCFMIGVCSLVVGIGRVDVRRSLLVVWCLLCVVCCLVSGVCCALCVVCCVLCVVCCWLFVV